MTLLARYAFRLYVAGGAPNSVQAVANLQAICKRHLAGQHKIEIIDVFREPRRALRDGVFLTPTLVKLEPSPAGRIVGSLNQPHVVLQVLGLEVPATWP